MSGRGEVFKSGGRVVKNVTGYDLCKLLCGSYGTLGVMTDVTVKVLPRPEKTYTVLLLGLDDAAAGEAMRQALGSPHEVSGAAHLPADDRYVSSPVMRRFLSSPQSLVPRSPWSSEGSPPRWKSDRSKVFPIEV